MLISAARAATAGVRDLVITLLTMPAWCPTRQTAVWHESISGHYGYPVTRYVAFLRGINVGGKQKIAMAELRAMLADLGFTDVATLLQSGNAVFTGKDDDEASVVRTLDAQLQATFDMPVRTVVRTADELAEVVANDPFKGIADDGAKYTVTFLSAPPGENFAAAFDPADIEPEKLTIIGREVYSWCPDGLADAQVNKVLTERRLGAVPTTRNWNTVTKLLALAQE